MSQSSWLPFVRISQRQAKILMADFAKQERRLANWLLENETAEGELVDPALLLESGDKMKTDIHETKPTVDDYLARANELAENGHNGGAAALYFIAGFPTLADDMRNLPDSVDDEITPAPEADDGQA